MQGIKSKIDDNDFLNYINEFDVLLFTECWNSQISNIEIKNFESISCSRPKCNAKAKRNSGGIIVYYKEQLSKFIEVVNIDNKGIMWFKLKDNESGSSEDKYICVCYIPPEDSNVYKNVNSPLYEFDFFEQLCEDVRKYSDFGQVYITGDFNARTGEELDVVPNVNLDRYVDSPINENDTSNLTQRVNDDKVVNYFGRKLLDFCKLSNCVILNGRLEKGQFTFNTIQRGKNKCSTVDYLLTNVEHVNSVNFMHIDELYDFSDHNPIIFMIPFDIISHKSERHQHKRVVWDPGVKDALLCDLNNSRDSFDSVTNDLLAGRADINESTNGISAIINKFTLMYCGKNMNSCKSSVKRHKAAWFNAKCKDSKKIYMESKKLYSENQTPDNKRI